jgi:hypothetical protein
MILQRDRTNKVMTVVPECILSFQEPDDFPVNNADGL